MSKSDSAVGSFRSLVELTRPFTLLPPVLGMVSGSVMGLGSDAEPIGRLIHSPWFYVGLGALLAGVMNAGSNIINQVTDRDIDTINKPGRPIPSGRVTVGSALAWSGLFFLGSLLLGLWIGVACFVAALGGALCSLAYSVPPLRLKQRGWAANGIIALARGLLLKVAGWACVASVLDPEPWLIGSIFFLFLMGATTSKDYSDMEGDRKGGIRSLPIIYGPIRAAWLTAPFYVLPWFLLSAFTWAGYLSGNATALYSLGFILALWGSYTCWLILRDPEELSRLENHPSWKHMYLMMMTAQVGLAGAYLV